MDESSITRDITGTFDGVDAVVASGDTFFFYDLFLSRRTVTTHASNLFTMLLKCE